MLISVLRISVGKEQIWKFERTQQLLFWSSGCILGCITIPI